MKDKGDIPTPADVVEGNELIAEFMNLKAHEWETDRGVSMQIWVNKDTEITEYDDPILRYHSSWDLLMPACNKALKVLQEMPPEVKARLKEESESFLAKFAIKTLFAPSDISGQLEISMVRIKLIDFIIWYNNQKLKP